MATNFDKVADESGKVSRSESSIPVVRTTMRWGAKISPSRMTIDDLLAETKRYLTQEDMGKVRRAYELAKKAHKGTLRRSGEPYIQHPLEVALLLAGMRIDADGIAAALLHDVVEDTDCTLEDLREQFGPAVANIVDGVTKFDVLAGTKPVEAVKDQNVANGKGTSDTSAEGTVKPAPPSLVDKRRARTETVRKMLLAMAEDPRVVVLKLADRLHNMRTLSAMSPAQQQNTSRETSEIYAPLARRLGMALAQADLEDLAFGYLEPEKYARLARQVDEEVMRRLPFINEVCRILRVEMKRAGIHADVMAWQKHLASINRKLSDVSDESGNALSQIHDLVSFRILVDTDYECYLALGHIHALWRPKDGRIKDFIATPKLNGYQSLHTTVFCQDNRLAEIQIRTHDMQRTADYGLASYWYYKERLSDDEHNKQKSGQDDANNPGSWRLSYREMVTWIEQLRDWQRALPQGADEFVEAVKGDIFQEQIFVFTPQGEVKDLPRGSTPLDMAYRIHTDIGDHCAGARIITSTDASGSLVTRLVPLDYELKGGEIVEIIVNKTVHPTRDWLSFARTAAARNKIRRYLKTYEREINLHLGRERLDLALKALGLKGLDETAEAALAALCQDETTNTALKKYATLDDVYSALGREDLLLEEVVSPLHAHLPSPAAADENDQAANGGGYTENEASSLVQLATCCCPLPGDSIKGLIIPNLGVVIHREDCPTLRRGKDPKDIVEVNWQQVHPGSYLLPVTLTAHDRSGLLRDVAAVVTDAGINMVSVTSTTNPSLRKATITATLEITGDDGVIARMESILHRLRQVKTVVNVERSVSY